MLVDMAALLQGSVKAKDIDANSAFLQARKSNVYSFFICLFELCFLAIAGRCGGCWQRHAKRNLDCAQHHHVRSSHKRSGQAQDGDAAGDRDQSLLEQAEAAHFMCVAVCCVILYF